MCNVNCRLNSLYFIVHVGYRPGPSQSRQSAKLFLQPSELGLPGFRGEGHTRCGERGSESPNSSEGTHCGTLVLCGVRIKVFISRLFNSVALHISEPETHWDYYPGKGIGPHRISRPFRFVDLREYFPYPFPYGLVHMYYVYSHLINNFNTHSDQLASLLFYWFHNYLTYRYITFLSHFFQEQNILHHRP